MEMIRKDNIQYAILQSRSPTCGVHQVYDGTFSGKLTDGDGVTAELLRREGIKVYGESQVTEMID